MLNKKMGVLAVAVLMYSASSIRSKDSSNYLPGPIEFQHALPAPDPQANPLDRQSLFPVSAVEGRASKLTMAACYPQSKEDREALSTEGRGLIGGMLFAMSRLQPPDVEIDCGDCHGEHFVYKGIGQQTFILALISLENVEAGICMLTGKEKHPMEQFGSSLVEEVDRAIVHNEQREIDDPIINAVAKHLSPLIKNKPKDRTRGEWYNLSIHAASRFLRQALYEQDARPFLNVDTASFNWDVINQAVCENVL